MSVPNSRPATGKIVTSLVIVGGAIAVCFAFVSNASPYGDFAEAKINHSDSMHVAGTIMKETLKTDLRHGTIQFNMKDEKGLMMPVVYDGPPPANIEDAVKVVAIGGVQGSEFHSNKLLIKCPSKYEAQKSPTS